MTPKEAYKKCFFEKRRIPELESIIINDPGYSYKYAKDVIKGRFKKGEKIIITDKICSYRYARDIIKRRWKRGEKNIVNDPEWSYLYARDVIEGLFHLGHPVIFNSGYRNEYINFLKSINYDLNKISEWLI